MPRTNAIKTYLHIGIMNGLCFLLWFFRLHGWCTVLSLLVIICVWLFCVYLLFVSCGFMFGYYYLSLVVLCLLIVCIMQPYVVTVNDNDVN